MKYKIMYVYFFLAGCLLQSSDVAVQKKDLLTLLKESRSNAIQSILTYALAKINNAEDTKVEKIIIETQAQLENYHALLKKVVDDNEFIKQNKYDLYYLMGYHIDSVDVINGLAKHVNGKFEWSFLAAIVLGLFPVVSHACDSDSLRCFFKNRFVQSYFLSIAALWGYFINRAFGWKRLIHAQFSSQLQQIENDTNKIKQYIGWFWQ